MLDFGCQIGQLRVLYSITRLSTTSRAATLQKGGYINLWYSHPGQIQPHICYTYIRVTVTGLISTALYRNRFGVSQANLILGSLSQSYGHFPVSSVGQVKEHKQSKFATTCTPSFNTGACYLFVTDHCHQPRLPPSF